MQVSSVYIDVRHFLLCVSLTLDFLTRARAVMYRPRVLLTPRQNLSSDDVAETSTPQPKHVLHVSSHERAIEQSVRTYVYSVL